MLEVGCLLESPPGWNRVGYSHYHIKRRNGRTCFGYPFTHFYRATWRERVGRVRLPCSGKRYTLQLSPPQVLSVLPPDVWRPLGGLPGTCAHLVGVVSCYVRPAGCIVRQPYGSLGEGCVRVAVQDAGRARRITSAGRGCWLAAWSRLHALCGARS